MQFLVDRALIQSGPCSAIAKMSKSLTRDLKYNWAVLKYCKSQQPMFSELSANQIARKQGSMSSLALMQNTFYSCFSMTAILLQNLQFNSKEILFTQKMS